MKTNIILTGSEGLLGTSFRNYAENKGYNIFCIDKLKLKRKNYFQCNILNEREVSKTIKNICDFNDISLLINNASANPTADKKMKKFKFSNYSLNEWKRNIEVDIFGSFLVSKYVLKYFEKKNKGKILNISSIYAILGPDQSIYGKRKKFEGYKPIEYSVAKSSLIGFTKALASFYSNSEIKINCLIYGGVINKQNKKFIKSYENKTILKRMAKVDEYNNYIDFLGGDLNNYMSGSCVVIDGGATSII